MFLTVFFFFTRIFLSVAPFIVVGRDDKFSHCIIYYRLRDVMRQSTMVFSEQKGLENLYGLMDYCSDIERSVNPYCSNVCFNIIYRSIVLTHLLPWAYEVRSKSIRTRALKRKLKNISIWHFFFLKVVSL